MNPSPGNSDAPYFVRALVDLDAVASNYRFLADRVFPRPVYAVVKADAYGHGAGPVATRLAREGADRFAVANVEEGVALRRVGIGGEILVLSRAEPEELPRISSYGLTPALYDAGQAEAFAEAAGGRTGPLAVHLEIDAGMGRAGIRPGELDRVIALISRFPRLSLSGTFTNLSGADEPESPQTARQVSVLVESVARLREAGIAPGLVHAANSAAILGAPPAWLDAVRPGLALYGVSPAEALESAALRPAMTLEARVASVRTVPAGTPLGYGGRFVTSRESTIAVLPIGYHDGLRRCMSGRVSVLLRGMRVPVVGAVSMDVTLVDATGTGVRRGDRAICLGRDGGETVTAWDLARAAGTIPYEILCGIGPRVERVHTGGRG